MKTQQTTPDLSRRFDSVPSHSLKTNDLQGSVPLSVPRGVRPSVILGLLCGASTLALIAAFLDRNPLVGAFAFVALFSFGMASAISAANDRLDAATDSDSDSDLDRPIWEPCHDCEEYVCNIHNEHAADCPCPGIDDWNVDPYTTPVRFVVAKRKEVSDV